MSSLALPWLHSAFLFLVADTRLYTLPCQLVCRYVIRSHLGIASGFCITAPAQLSATVLPCTQPCFIRSYFLFLSLIKRSICRSVYVSNSPSLHEKTSMQTQSVLSSSDKALADWTYYSTRIKELGNWREAISVKRLGFMIKFFTTKCTYRCTMLFKVLEPFQQIHFFLSKNFFFSFWLILTTKITLKKNSFMCILVR